MPNLIEELVKTQYPSLFQPALDNHWPYCVVVTVGEQDIYKLVMCGVVLVPDWLDLNSAMSNRDKLIDGTAIVTVDGGIQWKMD